MVKNLSLVYKKVPSELPAMGEHLAFETSDLELDGALEEGTILVKVQWISLDPYMRIRLRQPGTKSYVPAFELDKPLTARAICQVLNSASSAYRKGQIISVMCDMSTYAVVPERFLAQAAVLDNPYQIDIAHYLGALGMPGLTAYSSFYEIGQPKIGETIFVSAASGAVGQLIVQLAKHEGLVVIGSAGDDKKIDFLKQELGLDKTFNYKKESTADALKRLAPDGIDIYYDNVGGETLEAALDAAKDHARFVECGQISQYNLRTEDRYGVKNLFLLVSKQLTMRGFVVGTIGPKYKQDHQEKVSKWISEGSFKATLDITKGLENSVEALLSLFSGRNFGKVVVKVE